MFARYMFVDDVRAPPPSKQPDFCITWDPTPDNVASAISSMDGEKIRLVIIAEAAPTDDSYFPWSGRGMLIGGGGPIGLYSCMVGMEDESTAHYLCDPTADPEEEVEIMRGHLTEMGRRYCVDFSTLLVAARIFSESGELSDELDWETREE